MSRLLLPTATALGALAYLAAAPAALAQPAAAPAPARAPAAAPAAAAPAAQAPARAAQAAKPARARAHVAAPANQPSARLQRAELAELGPKVRAEVEKRATGGNTIRGVLETMLLNNLELRDPGNQIVALDLGRGAAVVQGPQQNLRLIHFDKETFAIK